MQYQVKRLSTSLGKREQTDRQTDRQTNRQTNNFEILTQLKLRIVSTVPADFMAFTAPAPRRPLLPFTSALCTLRENLHQRFPLPPHNHLQFEDVFSDPLPLVRPSKKKDQFCVQK